MPEIKIVTGSRNHLEKSGPILAGSLTHSDAQRKIRSDEGRNSKSVNGKVLFDTGASGTAIDQSVAQNLGLLIIGPTKLNTPSHSNVPSLEYEGKIVIDGHPFHLERAVGAPVLETQGVLALIGRDILSLGKLEYDGRTGIVTFRF